MNTSWYDTIATLGCLAGITEHVRLMSHVYVLPYRHPLMTAKAFMTLDELSGGRALLGVGAGHVQAEFELLGVDFEHRGSAARRRHRRGAGRLRRRVPRRVDARR